jgi:hypothetical protein
MVHASAPAVGKAAHFASIALNNFVVAVAKKRRVEVNQVYRFALQLF